MSCLEQLKGSGTMVVADTGDFEAISAFKPRDATTNPSLILAAAKMPQYSSIVEKCVAEAKTGSTMAEQVRETGEMREMREQEFQYLVFGEGVARPSVSKCQPDLDPHLHSDERLALHCATRDGNNTNNLSVSIGGDSHGQNVCRFWSRDPESCRGSSLHRG